MDHKCTARPKLPTCNHVHVTSVSVKKQNTANTPEMHFVFLIPVPIYLQGDPLC